ncbi:MAG: hypothetical protein E7265_07395 [Lachnospiraceae bacterium]|nr:hypothetical protein [Lachnospiraceae bacterium]
MAFHDWNQDGKKDWQDNYIEYNIYKSSTGKSNSSSGYSSSGGGCSTLGAIIGVIVVFLVLGGIISIFTPKCSMSGCDNDAVEGERYCYLHDFSYSVYGNPDYNAVYRESQKRREKYSGENNIKTATPEQSEASDYSNITSSNNSTTNNDSSSLAGNSSSKSYSYESYDEGYEDVMDNEDYDDERYETDSEYANGVDDAMEEYYEEYGEEW